ncbi:hypothetical protein GCM10011359_09060 [Nesterenkonia alkaliphila]|nr:hypothetical protein GCM10011359_09060 [Nesterenkonia alkaliphila]
MSRSPSPAATDFNRYSYPRPDDITRIVITTAGPSRDDLGRGRLSGQVRPARPLCTLGANRVEGNLRDSD